MQIDQGLVAIFSLNIATDQAAGRLRGAALAVPWPVHCPLSMHLLMIALCSDLQAVQAAQITFEDHFMADLDVAPLKIVGYEGLFGSIVMMAVMLPAVSFVKGHEGDGLHEDTLDTLHVSSLICSTVEFQLNTQGGLTSHEPLHSHLASAPSPCSSPLQRH